MTFTIDVKFLSTIKVKRKEYAMDLKARYQKNPSVVFRKIAEEFVLVPITNSVGQLDSIYTLNETGAHIWEMLDGKNSLEDVAKALEQKFDVSNKEAIDDLCAFIEDLLSIEFISKI